MRQEYPFEMSVVYEVNVVDPDKDEDFKGSYQLGGSHVRCCSVIG